MPLSKCLSSTDSVPNKNDPSSGSENNIQYIGKSTKVDGQLTNVASLPSSTFHANPVDVVGSQHTPSSEPLPDASGNPTTNKMLDNPSSEPLPDASGNSTTNKMLEVIDGSKVSNVDVVSCENTQNPKREFINQNPAEEEGKGSKRRRGKEEEVEDVEFLKDPKNKLKTMDVLSTPPPNVTNFLHTILSAFVQGMHVVMGRKPAAPTRPGGFTVSAFGRHVPDGPHATTSYDDMDTESEDDEVNSSNAV